MILRFSLDDLQKWCDINIYNPVCLSFSGTQLTVLPRQLSKFGKKVFSYAGPENIRH